VGDHTAPILPCMRYKCDDTRSNVGYLGLGLGLGKVVGLRYLELRVYDI